jgi:hypothetical protein
VSTVTYGVNRTGPLPCVWLRCDYGARDRAKAVPGYRWHDQEHFWYWPLTRQGDETVILKALLAAFPEAVLGAAASLPRSAPTPLPECGPSLGDLVSGANTIYPWRRTPYLHQKEVVTASVLRHRLLVLYEMGLGKTQAAIEAACLALEAGIVARVYIICPATVRQVWRDEINACAWIAPDDVAIVRGNPPATNPDRAPGLSDPQYRRRMLERRAAWTIMGYEAATIEVDLLNTLTKGQHLIVDEAHYCVPGDTLIDTPDGPRSIPYLRDGNTVWGWDDATQTLVPAEVTATMKHSSEEALCELGALQLTGNHPVWTANRGYVPAAELEAGDVLSYLRGVRNEIPSEASARCDGSKAQTILQQKLLGQVEDAPAGISADTREMDTGANSDSAENYSVSSTAAGGRECAGKTPAFGQQCFSVSPAGVAKKSPCEVSGAGLLSPQRGQRQASSESSRIAGGEVVMADGVPGEYWTVEQFRLSDVLQVGPGKPASDAGHRGGRSGAFGEGPGGTGREEGQLPEDTRMDCIVLHEQGSAGADGECTGGHQRSLFNIETTTGNYFANGVLVHNCKNPRAKRTKAVFGFKPARAIIQTGTPVVNTPSDAYCMATFCEPGLLGKSIFDFRDRFVVIKQIRAGGRAFDKEVGYKDIAEASRRLLSVGLRKLKRDCLDLPPKVRTRRYCEMSAAQYEAYAAMLGLVGDQLRQLQDEHPGHLPMPAVLSQLVRLQQVADGFYPDPDHPERDIWIPDACKFEAADELLEEAIENGRKVVVWTRFVALARKVAERYSKHGAEYLAGEVPTDTRNAHIAAFTHDRTHKVLVLTMGVGGLGLNLQAADCEIFIDRWWSPALNFQCEDRCHRSGQRNEVDVHILLAEGTIDEHVNNILKRKEKIADSMTGDAADPLAAPAEPEGGLFDTALLNAIIGGDLFKR